MPRDLSKLFSLVVPENLRKDSAFSSVSQAIAFDDLADFAEERERIRRKVQSLQDSAPKVDFSNFANHIFFDSAVSKFTIAKDKILRQYPFDGSSEDRDVFVLSSSLYEQHVLSEWPTYMGYIQLTASARQAIVALDPSNKLALGSSSLYVSARIKPKDINDYNPILQVVSQSLSTNDANGYLFLTYQSVVGLVFFSGGAEVQTITAPIPSWLTQSWGTVAAIYDQAAQSASLFLNDTLLVSQPCSPGAIGFASTDLIIGSGTIYDVGSFNGALDELRVMHTASALYHQKNYNRPIVSEPFVKAYYKFNEGITNHTEFDSTVVDYSQNALHGKIINYVPQIRQSGSTSSQDGGDPILYDAHPLVDSYIKQRTTEAQLYDQANRSYILRLIPEDIIIEDQNAQGLLVSFALALARYFDDLKIYIDQFDNLRITNYQDANSTPDVMLPMLKQYFGWKATDHFGDANPLEFFFGEGITSSGSVSTALSDIRDQFWRRILNSLPYLYKTKGKRANLPSFFNVLGINPNLINLKEYGHLQTTTLQDELLIKEKPAYFLGFGKNGLTGSYVSVPSLRSAGTYTNWAIETYAQLPYPSQNLSGSFLSGTIWQVHPSTGSTPSFALTWQLSSVGNASGALSVSDTSGTSLLAPRFKYSTATWRTLPCNCPVQQSVWMFVTLTTAIFSALQYWQHHCKCKRLSGRKCIFAHWCCNRELFSQQIRWILQSGQILADKFKLF